MSKKVLSFFRACPQRLRKLGLHGGRGFTIIELLVVIGLIGVLATSLVIIINPQTQLEKARDAQRKSDLVQIQKALELYYNDNGGYPQSTSDYLIEDAGTGAISWGGSWGNYMPSVPKDPHTKGLNKYIYYSTDSNSYFIYAHLEREENDSQVCNLGAACSSMVGNSIVAEACGAICNYGVTSPNEKP